MANNVADARAAIYTRLASAPTFHPASADLFEDWTLQGGDIITVSSGNDSYNLPIYGMRMKWDGGTRVSVESSGNVHRDALEKMAQKETAKANNEYRSSVKQNGAIRSNTGKIQEFDNSDIWVNRESVWAVCGSYTVYTDPVTGEKTLSVNEGTALKLQRNGAEFGVYDEGNLTGGIMVTAINGQTETKIKGNKVVIGTQDTDTVSIADAFDITTYNGYQSVKIKKQLLVDSNTYINGASLYVSPLNGSGGLLQATEVHVGTGGKLIFNDRNNTSTPAITRDDALGLIDTFSHVALTGPVNNVYKLWYLPSNKSVVSQTPSTSDGWIEVGTFSRAISSWSGGWSGNAVMTVAASPQSQSYTVGFGTTYNSHDMDLELVANGAVEQDTGSIIKVPVAIRQLTGAQSSPTSRYTKDLSVACAGLLESKTITSNNTYTPSTGKIGFSSVNVTITPELAGNWSSSVLTVSSTPTAAANYTVGFGTTYGSHSVDLELTTNGAASQDSGSTISVPLKIQQLTGSQSAPASRYEKNVAVACSGLLETKSVNSNDTYTPSSGKIGFSSFTVNVHPTLEANWASGKITVTSSPSASSNLTRTLAQGNASWASNMKSVTLPVNATWGSSGQYSESTGWSAYIDATPAYYAGSASVLMSSTRTWATTPSTNIDVEENTVTYSTSGRTDASGASEEKTGSLKLIGVSSSNGLTATFYCTHTSTSTSRRILKKTQTCSDANLLPENIKDRVTIFGVTGNYSGSSTTPTLTGNWSSGTLTVSSSPAASSNYVRTLASGTPVWDSYYTSVTIPINVTYGSSGQYSESTGYSVYLNTYNERLAIWNEAYVAGWNAFHDQPRYIPTDSGSDGQFKLPGSSDSSMTWSYENWADATNLYNSVKKNHSFTVVNVKAGETTGGVELWYGVLYYKVGNSYTAASTSDAYWYRSSTRVSGSTTVYY